MCRGRPKCRRRVESVPDVTYFKPRGIPLDELEIMNLTIEEFEAVRLIDLEGLEQEQAAVMMGVSRRAFWDDIQSARKKIADALVNGKAIEIKGGNYVAETASNPQCYGGTRRAGKGACRRSVNGMRKSGEKNDSEKTERKTKTGR